MKDQTIPRVLALFVLIGVILVAVATVAVRNLNRAVTASDWVNHTNALLGEFSGLAASLQAGEGSLRLYALSGEPRDQAACRLAYEQMGDHLEVAKALTRGDPAEHNRVLRIAGLAGARAEFATSVLQARTQGRPETAAALLAADAGTAALNAIFADLDKLRQEYMERLAERDKAAYLQAQTTHWTVWSGVLINFVLLAGAGWIMVGDIRFRRAAAAALEAANAQLETKVRERTAELSAANSQLTLEHLQDRWANQALEHQLRYDSLIINSISDLVLVVTKAGNITRHNPAVVHLTGWSAPELINRPLASVALLAPQPGDPRATAPDPVGHAMQDGRDLRERPAIVRDRDGREHPVQLALYPLRDGNKVVGGVVTMRTNPPA